MGLGLGFDTGNRLRMGGTRRRATVWRRNPQAGELVVRRGALPAVAPGRSVEICVILASDRSGSRGSALIGYRELEGPGRLRYLVSARMDGKSLIAASWRQRLGGSGGASLTCANWARSAVLALAPEEQYLVATGRTYFRGLSLRRLCGECSSIWRRRGWTPSRDRIFMVAVRDPSGATETLEAQGEGTPARPADSRAGRESDCDRSGRHREPQPARLRPAVSRPARANPGRAARARADRAAGTAACARRRRGNYGGLRWPARAVSSHPGAN